MGKKFEIKKELSIPEMEEYMKVEARMPDCEWFRKDVRFPDDTVMRIGAKNFADKDRKMDFYCDLQKSDGTVVSGSFKQKESIFDGKWEVVDKTTGNKYSVQLDGPQRKRDISLDDEIPKKTKPKTYDREER